MDSRSGWRQHKADAFPPRGLTKRHRSFRWRVVMSPSYRADPRAALEAEPGLSAAELARRAYGSFASAWSVKRDAALVRGAPADGGRSHAGTR